MAGALRTACDRKSQRNNPQLQEVRSLSSQSLLQLCGLRRPHSWSDLHLITLTNKAPNFVLKVVRVFSDFKRKFDSFFLQGQPLLWVTPRVNYLLGQFSHTRWGGLVKPNSLKERISSGKFAKLYTSYDPPFSLYKSVKSQGIPTKFNKNFY